MLFPNKDSLSKVQMQKLMSASITRLFIIKLKGAAINVKVSTIVPDYEYAVSHGFDISSFDLTAIPSDFSGFIFTRNWDESIVSLYRINKGIKIKSCRLRSANETQPVNGTVLRTSSSSGCWYCGFNGAIGASGQFECTSHFTTGDIPGGGGGGDDTQCQHWESTSGNGDGFDWNDYPDDPEDPEFPDLCALYGIGCNEGGGGGGGGEDPPPPPTNPCTDAQPIVSSTNSLTQTSQFNIAKSNILSAAAADAPNIYEHGLTFGKDASGTITTSPMKNGGPNGGSVATSNWPGGFADLHNHPNLQPPSPGDLYTFIKINRDVSNTYNTRMVIASDGSVYAMVIINSSLASQFYSNPNTAPVDISYGPDFPQAIFENFEYARNHVPSGTSSIVREEMAMAFILDKYSTGMALLKQNSDGTFKRLRTTETTNSDNSKNYTANNCP